MFKFLRPSVHRAGSRGFGRLRRHELADRQCGQCPRARGALAAPAISHRRRSTRQPSRAELAATASGAQLLEITGAPACGVDFYYVKFWTVGGAGETTESSGALMVPTGAAPACSGRAADRGICARNQHQQGAEHRRYHQYFEHRGRADRRDVRGARATSWWRRTTRATISRRSAITRTSTRPSNPAEMMDILAAARTALPNTLSSATSDSGTAIPHRIFRGRLRRHGDAAGDAGGRR